MTPNYGARALLYPAVYTIGGDHEFPAEEQPLTGLVDWILTTLWTEGDDGDDDDGDSSEDDADDEDEDEEDEEEEEEEEHLAPS
ncbi:hypothetical protein Tco_1476734 [Tanacetum coccineum]